MVTETAPGLRAARDLFAAGRMADAHALLETLAAAEGDAPAGELLLFLSRARKMVGQYAEAAAAAEAAYAAFARAGDHVGAAQAAIAMVNYHGLQGDRLAARGWEARGARHLDRVGECVERGYLAMSWVACDVHDPADLFRRTDVALAVARDFKDHQLEIRALGDRGLALVSMGRVDEGFELLDEVMVALTGGEVADPEWRCKTFCALMSACERAGDEGRARTWSAAVERDPHLQELGWATTDCLVAGGAFDALGGRWDSAEARLEAALHASAGAPHHRATSAARIAEIRIQQGRIDEAAAVLAGHEDSLDAAAAMARLRLVQGRLDEAAGLLRTAARALGADLLRLGPVLAMRVEVELRRGDTPAARRAVRSLLGLEEDCNSNDIRAMARLGAARLALSEGATERAIEDLETALLLLVHRDRPLLAAQVRLELARALAQAGESASALAEARAALDTFERLGVVPDGAVAGEMVEGLAAAGAGEASTADGGVAMGRAPRGANPPSALTRREDEVARLAAAGLSNKEIATRLFLSVRTVESHMDRILGKLDFRNRTQLAAWLGRAEAAGSVVIT